MYPYIYKLQSIFIFFLKTNWKLLKSTCNPYSSAGFCIYILFYRTIGSVDDETSSVFLDAGFKVHNSS